MSPQKHSKIVDGKRYIWFTEKLWKISKDFEVFEVNVEDFPELDMDCWFGNDTKPTLRKIAEHCDKINMASLKYPIILNSDGSLMDGGHRLCKALISGIKTVKAVKFESMPKPDKIVEIET